MPHPSDTESLFDHVKRGFRRAGAWLLGLAWLGVVFGGFGEAFAPAASYAEGHHPHRIVGYALLIAAGLVMVMTAEHWKRVFPGIMIGAVFNSFLELSHGHAVNYDSVPVAPTTAIVHLLVTSGVAALALTFKSRRLSAIDRAALIIFVGTFFWQAVDHRFAEIKLICGALCVLLAWAIDRRRVAHTFGTAKN